MDTATVSDFAPLTNDVFGDLCASGEVLAPNYATPNLLGEVGGGPALFGPIVIEIVAVVVGVIAGEIASIIAHKIVDARRNPDQGLSRTVTALEAVRALQAYPWGDAREFVTASTWGRG
jgi:hypothetical protein